MSKLQDRGYRPLSSASAGLGVLWKIVSWHSRYLLRLKTSRSLHSIPETARSNAPAYVEVSWSKRTAVMLPINAQVCWDTTPAVHSSSGSDVLGVQRLVEEFQKLLTPIEACYLVSPPTLWWPWAEACMRVLLRQICARSANLKVLSLRSPNCYGRARRKTS